MLRRLMLFLVFTIGASTSVTGVDLSNATPEASISRVEQRAHAYLDALKVQDLQTAYLMHAGAHDKTLTAADFRQRMTASKSILIDYVIKKVSIENGTAHVELDLTYQYPQLHKPMTMPRTQQWMLINAEWYLQAAAQARNPQSDKPAH